MKITVSLLLLLLSSASFATSYVSCGLGLRQHDWPESGWTKDDGDIYRFYECQWQTSPNISQEGFFLEIPTFSWSQEYPTGMSRNRHQLMARDFDLEWPFYRYQEFLFGVSAGHSRYRQQHELSQSLTINQSITVMPAGEEALLTQEAWYLGVLMDIRYTGSPLTYVTLTHHEYSQALAVSKNNGPTGIHDANIRLWQIKIARDPLYYGWQWHWSLALQKGKIKALDGINVKTLNTTDILGLDGHLGLLWRYRASRTLHPYINASVHFNPWLIINSNTIDPNAKSLHTISYEFSAGLSWRFR